MSEKGHTMGATLRWTSADLELLQHDDKRYEIIDGELYVSTQRSFKHQVIALRIGAALQAWSDQADAGGTSIAPGLVFADDDDVAPDVVWISNERLAGALDTAGHLRVAPELVVEILSPGSKNVRRDRDAKLKLYARRDVSEYWIVDPGQRTIDVYRRQDAGLHLVVTLHADDTMESPVLPGFRVPVSRLFGRS